MRWIPCFAPVVACLLLTATALGAPATTARLVLPVDVVKPGESFLAGIELTMKPGWHTYWRNGGDSGAPTTLEWQLPEGVSPGEIRVPAPERHAEKDLVTYIFHGTTFLLVPLTIGPDVAPGPLDLAVKVKWLECEKLCIPGQATVTARVTVGSESRPSAQAPLIRATEEGLPKTLPDGSASAVWDGPAQGEVRPLLIRWRPPQVPGTPDFYPDTEEGFEVLTPVDRLPNQENDVVLRKKVRKFEGNWPAQIKGLLVMANARNLPTVAFEATLPVSDPAASSAALPGVGEVATLAAPRIRIPSLSLVGAIGLGFLGGIILNIMPCVLPVIALKILGFVRKSGSRPAEIRKLGMVYALGVWFSFLVLAGVVIAVKRTAGIAGWGMQFGNPVFLVAMTTLILLVALSLFGVFEINLTGRALDKAGNLASKEGTAGSFFNGMLAVALATPCTAPFLAPALGYAFSANALTIVLVFTAVAMGLAAPYVVLSWQPGWLRFLPKPGAWMERFKVAMGFPMLATAFWLFTLAGAHFGEPGFLWLGVFLLGVSVAAWIWGEFVQRGRTRQALAMAIALIILGGIYYLTLERELAWRRPASEYIAVNPAERTGAPGDGIPWRPWSRDAVQAAQREGRPVFVDFTADWCWTCKVNERTSINIASVRDQLEIINAVSLKGDYTRTPPVITEELQRFGRAGVPLVVVYSKDPAKDPVVLPEVLTPGIVLDALKKAGADSK